MWKWFTSVDVDGNGRITAVELQQALKNGNHTSFDISTIEMLIRLFVCVKLFPMSLKILTQTLLNSGLGPQWHNYIPGISGYLQST